MADQATIPEPPDGQLVMVGSEDNEQVFLRDDRGLKPDDLHRWWSLNGEHDTFAVTWAGVVAKGDVVLLYRRSELDAAVAQAKADAGLRVVGDHIIEPGGWCRTDGTRHSPEEIARLEDRLAAEPPPEQVAEDVLTALAEEGHHGD